jgi:TPR repeat protein
MKKIIFLIIVIVLFYECNNFIDWIRDKKFSDGLSMYSVGNYMDAEKLFKSSCDKRGSEQACEKLARLYYTDGSFTNAISQMQKRCNTARHIWHQPMCEDIGYIYEIGGGVEQNYATAAKYYNKACSNGSDWMCQELAEAEQNNNIKNAHLLANVIEDSCISSHSGEKQGNYDDCYFFGSAYMERGDVKKAEYFLKKACMSLHTFGCRKLAMLHKIKGNLSEANFYQKLSDAFSDEKTQERLLRAQREIFDRWSSDGKTILYLDDLCEKQNAEACYHIAFWYADRYDELLKARWFQDDTTTYRANAKIYFHKACDFGSKDGCNAEKEIQ